MRRIQALGDSAGRLAKFTGESLSPEQDAELQDCVEQAAVEAGAPIALVSLIVERAQLFRAHVGLPPGLKVAQATDRNSSFCQFVVRDGDTFQVDDARADDRVPKDLVERYGVRAYLGVPVQIDDEVVGSFCVIDTEPRSFDPSLETKLKQIAVKVSARLTALSKIDRRRRRDELLEAGLRPAFFELRNTLVPLQSASRRAQILAAELEPIFALAKSKLPAEDVRRALQAQALDELKTDMREFADDMADSYDRLEATVMAIREVVSAAKHAASLRHIVEVGLELCRHVTKLVGGVQLGSGGQIGVVCGQSTGGLLISMAASSLAGLCLHSRAATPLIASFDDSGERATLHLKS